LLLRDGMTKLGFALVASLIVGASCSNTSGVREEPAPDSPAPPTCDDGLQNGGESDLDCGGADCNACTNGAVCGDDRDCESGNCVPAPCEGESCVSKCQPPPCGGPNEPCCADSTCTGNLVCNKDGDICNHIALRSGVNCNHDCKTPNELCNSNGFTGAVTTYTYFVGQCAGASDCPTGWLGLTCADWCGGVNCAGRPYCGGSYPIATDTPSPTTPICTSDHGGNCSGDNPGYYVRAQCF
jgi:hypothetical protein